MRFLDWGIRILTSVSYPWTLYCLSFGNLSGFKQGLPPHENNITFFVYLFQIHIGFPLFFIFVYSFYIVYFPQLHLLCSWSLAYMYDATSSHTGMRLFSWSADLLGFLSWSIEYWKTQYKVLQYLFFSTVCSCWQTAPSLSSKEEYLWLINAHDVYTPAQFYCSTSAMGDYARGLNKTFTVTIKTHQKSCQYHYSDLYCDITLCLAIKINLSFVWTPALVL